MLTCICCAMIRRSAEQHERRHLAVIADAARRWIVDRRIAFVLGTGRAELQSHRTNMNELVDEVRREIGLDTMGRTIGVGHRDLPWLTATARCSSKLG